MTSFYLKTCTRCNEQFKIYRGPFPEIDRDHCENCEEEIQNEITLDHSIQLLLKTLNPQNRERLAAMSLEDQRCIAMQAWVDGIITWGKVRPSNQGKEHDE